MFLNLNLFLSNGRVSTKLNDKRDDFDFDMVNFPFMDGDVPRRTSYGIYTSRKHAYIILTPLNPLLYNKTEVYRSIYDFSYFCSKT